LGWIKLKGETIWILAVFSVLSGANVVNAVIMWFNLGPESTFTPYLFGNLTGAIPIYVYISVSTIVTAVFLGATSHKIVTELSYADQINAINKEVNRLEDGLQSQQEVLESVQAKMFFVDESLEHNRQEFSRGFLDQKNALKQTFERGHKSQRKIMDGVQEQVFLLDKRLNSFKKGLEKQREATKEVIGDFLVSLGPQLGDIKEIVEKQRGEIENALIQIEQKEKNTKAVITEQKNELAEVRLKLEKLEKCLVKPEPLLGSQSNVEEVKGIGYGKRVELKEIGITNVGEFIMADPEIVAGRMCSSKKTVEKLQGRAQLSMVPGVKEKYLSLLEAVNVNDRSSLSAQDPIELSKKMSVVFEAKVRRGKISPVDKPTIEEIDSWIKFSKR
jgi:hypothetical protein